MLGEFIILRRKDLGLKRKELAEKLDISYNYLTLIETNKRQISKRLVPTFAKVLQVQESEIILHNTTSNGIKEKKDIVTRQISSINKKLVQVKTDEIILKKERDMLCKKLAILNRQEDDLRDKLEEV